MADVGLDGHDGGGVEVCDGSIDIYKGEGEERREKKGEALGKVVVPIISAVEDCQGLGDVEIEKSERWEYPLAVVESVESSCYGEDKKSAFVSASLWVSCPASYPQNAVSRAKSSRSRLPTWRRA